MKYLYVIAALLFAGPAHAEEHILRIYQDADLSNHIESSQAIQKGIEVAFDEIDNEIAGYKVEFKYLNHRGNVVRSKKNYETFLEDPHALVIYSGIHSPPLITNRAFINESKALTLVPWAAGGPITRYPSKENWIFRLSVDDTRAGPVIIDSAMKDKKCTSPHLLLEDSPWGDSNLKSMSKALKEHNITAPNITRFGWNIADYGARVMMRKIVNSGSACIILVSNAIEGAVIAKALIDVKKTIPLISHWGITEGNFHEKISVQERNNLDLTFIQSCFAFTNSNQTPFSKNVFERLKTLSNRTIEHPNDLKSAVGFIHAYDLTKVLIAAINQSGLSGNNVKDRDAIRLALENLQTPTQGLVKTYEAPYSAFDAQTNPNAHEALNKNDYCMARYGAQDEVLIVETSHE
jgi:branched-chain amino acid transport system substrate-binding protein